MEGEPGSGRVLWASHAGTQLHLQGHVRERVQAAASQRFLHCQARPVTARSPGSLRNRWSPASQGRDPERCETGPRCMAGAHLQCWTGERLRQGAWASGAQAPAKSERNCSLGHLEGKFQRPVKTRASRAVDSPGQERQALVMSVGRRYAQSSNPLPQAAGSWTLSSLAASRAIRAEPQQSQTGLVGHPDDSHRPSKGAVQGPWGQQLPSILHRENQPRDPVEGQTLCGPGCDPECPIRCP